METKNLNKTEQEATNKLLAYFKNVPCNIKVQSMGHMIDVQVEYYDFKPVNIVRKAICQMLPNLYNIELSRSFTNNTYITVLHELMDSMYEVTIKDGIDTYRTVDMHTLFEEHLFARDLTRTPRCAERMVDTMYNTPKDAA